MSAPLDRLLEQLENFNALDAPARQVARVVSPLLGSARLRDLLSGRWMGHPVHPALVQVPAGALLSAVVLDATAGQEGRAASRRLIAVGLLSAIPAALAGWSDWSDTEGAEKRVGLVHAASNLIGLGAFAVSYRARASGRGRVSALVGASALGVGGWLGGHLSYALGVGVDTTAFQSGPSDWTEVSTSDAVTEALLQVDAGGTRLLLTRVDGAVVALADRCTHRGAPLSDGEREGDCVVCPWHGSEFSLSDGSVQRGPATRPQPTYETREQGGRVDVRRSEPRALRTNPV